MNTAPCPSVWVATRLQDNQFNKTMPKYYEDGAVPATFSQLREAYLTLGLSVQELPITYSSAPVKYVHEGVSYKLDCHHDLDDVPTKAAKFYVLLERHHDDIKRIYEVWAPLCKDELLVMSGGGLQLQAFFTSQGRYQGILYLSKIDDGRFSELEAMLTKNSFQFTPYAPDVRLLKGPHTLDIHEPWLSALPDVPNIKMRSTKDYQFREPFSAK